MNAYFPNHQLYLAEKCTWLDRQIGKCSKRAIMKIESLKVIAQAEDFVQTQMVKKLVNDSFFTEIHNRVLLQREGFYQANLSN